MIFSTSPTSIRILFTLTLVSFLTTTLAPYGQTRVAQADTVDNLKTMIDEKNNDINNLENDIKLFQTQLTSTVRKSNDLKGALSELDTSKKKLETNLKLTEAKMSAAELTIKKLSLDIGSKSEEIELDRSIIRSSLQKIKEAEDKTLLANLLDKNSLSEAWTAVEEYATLQSGIREVIAKTQTAKVNLESNKAQTEKKKTELVTLKKDLSTQKVLVAQAVNEKSELLKETKNTESNYKKILTDKIAKKEAFEKELLAFESALKIAIDPSLIPPSGKGVLQWPLDKVIVTQYFGNTEFATKNAQVYNGKGHTGIDLGAPTGTAVKSALSGTVIGVGNTDLIRGCYSYGKWIMIEHPGGLTTLYAHLSLPSVTKGAQVFTGQIIGYSGNTGYSTGPHLHFGVYASQGVQITTLSSSTNCKGALIPLADIKAYLNPLSFI